MTSFDRWICSLAVLAGVVVARASISAQEDYEVSSVDFVGNQTISDGALEDQVSLHSAGFFTRLFTDREPSTFSDEAFEEDSLSVVRHYQRRGFLNVSVGRGDFEVDVEEEKVGVVFTIEEGLPVIIDSVSLRFTGVDSARAAAMADSAVAGQQQLTLAPGKRFEDALLQSDRRQLAGWMRDLGFPYVRVDADLEVNKDHTQVTVVWTIEPGPYSIFGDVVIKGNDFVAAEHIRKQLVFSRGEGYQESKIERSQEQVYDLGTFDVVTVNSQLTEQRDSTVDVELQVMEAARFVSRFGVGYGREDDFRVFTDFRLLGFLDDIHRFNLYAKHSGLVPYEVELRFTRPAFLTPRTTGIVRPAVIKQEEPAFTVVRIVGSAALQHRFSRELSATTVLAYERLDLDTASVSQEGLEQEDFDESLDEYSRGSIRLETAWDRSQPRLDPSHGFFAASTFKLSGFIFKSISKYGKMILDLRKYTPLGATIFASRVKVGAIDAYSEVDFIPIEDRLYSGGSTSVRGWARSELGPVDADGQPIGGNSLLEVGLELRYPIFGRLKGVVFTDWGNVWRSPFTYRVDELRYSAGLGFRFATPVGKIRTDFARPIFDDSKIWQFHLSIGPAF